MKNRQDNYGDTRVHKTDKDHCVRGCTRNKYRRCGRGSEMEPAVRRPLGTTRGNDDLSPTQLAYIRNLRTIMS